MGESWDKFKGSVRNGAANIKAAAEGRFGADNVNTALDIGKHLILPGVSMLLGKLIHGKKYSFGKALMYGLGGAAADFAINGYGGWGGWGANYMDALEWGKKGDAWGQSAKDEPLKEPFTGSASTDMPYDKATGSAQVPPVQ